jgi:polyisoprenoid-binding protein YceI
MVEAPVRAPRPTDVPSPRRRTRRWRRRALPIAGLVLGPVLLATAVYVFLFVGNSPARLTLSAAAPNEVPPANASQVTGTWIVAAESVAGYRVQEKLASLPAPSEAVGRTHDVVGTLTVRLEGDTLVADAATVQVNVTTLVSDQKPRDNRIRTSGLESNKYPTASFVLSGPVRLPPEVAKGEATTVEVKGLLTIHGSTREVTLPLQVRLGGQQGEVVGSLEFPFTDFGMDPPNIGDFVTVDPDATLELQLFLERSA